MKISRDEWYNLKERLAHLELNSNLVKRDDLITCEKCKCLMYKNDAIKGKSIIKRKTVYHNTYNSYNPLGALEGTTEEYLFTPYYCQRCKPKSKGESK